MSETTLHAILDRPNSYIGRSVPRPNVRRLLQGRGAFVDDIRLPRMVHVAFVRSPYAHARIESIDTAAAKAPPDTFSIGASSTGWRMSSSSVSGVINVMAVTMHGSKYLY